jgi:hypothetical protein
MGTVRHISISIRSQAILVLALVALWGVSFAACQMAPKRFFWVAAFTILPFVIAVFASILFVSHRRSTRTYQQWFCAASIAAVTCWGLILTYFLVAWLW